MKPSSTLLKCLAGLAFVAVITFGKSAAFGAEAHNNYASANSQSSGGMVIACAVLSVAGAGIIRRKS